MALTPFKVFRHGKGTVTLLEFVDGKPRRTMRQTGQGRFLDSTFETAQAARDSCAAELTKDKSAILYVVQDDLILETVLDQEFHQAKRRRGNRVYGFTSTLFIAAASWAAVTSFSPYSHTANLVFIGGFVALYLMLLWIHGAGNIEAAVLMVIILVLTCMLLPALKRVRERSHQAPHSPNATQGP